VLGSVYKGGSVLFSRDGRLLLSPVGNRISVFDLLEHRVSTIDACTHRDIASMAMTPSGALMLVVDVEGGGAFINVAKRRVLCQYHFKQPVSCARFSPDSRLVAVSHGRNIQLWRCPPMLTQYRPLTLMRTLTGHYDEVRWMEWSEDGKYLLSGSEDMTVRLHRVWQEEMSESQTSVAVAGEEGVKRENATDSSASSSTRLEKTDLPPITLTGHRGAIVGCFFGQPSASMHGAPMVYTVSKDGALLVWNWVSEDKQQKSAAQMAREAEEEAKRAEEMELKAKAEAEGRKLTLKQKEKFKLAPTHVAQPKRRGNTALFGGRGKFKLAAKHYFAQNHAKVMCCALHQASQVDLLVVGFSNGVFGLYELPDFNNIHMLSMSQKRISSVAINASGEWLAFGCAKLGQLLVWEWQSESYILKQQGHYFQVNAIDFSPDGQVMASGGDDGKVKLWNTTTGHSFITFTNHTAPVTGCHWSGQGNVLLTSSMDGTVRAFDLVRYRNFRTLTTPQPAQLSCLAVDPAGEVVCAGALEPFEIYVWSLQTGKLLDVCAGHEGPLAGLAFAASASLLASCSWDKTVKLWDVYTGKGLVETLTHSSDVLCCAFRPDGKELCSATLDGQLSFWEPGTGTLKGVIEGKRDIQGGRRVGDARTALTATHNANFTSVTYSADGRSVLAGGNSRFVCIYDVASKLLIRKFVISSSLSLDGILDKLDSRRMTDAGKSMDLIEDELLDEHDDDIENRLDTTLPGAQSGDFSSRRTRLAVRSKCVKFAPTGQQWAAATTDGLLLFSLDSTLIFDPSELDMDITPANVRMAVEQEDYASALRMSLSLNQVELLQLVVESTPLHDIPLVARSIPPHRLARFLTFLSDQLASSAHLAYLLQWAHTLMSQHAKTLQANSTQLMTTFRHMAKTITQQHKDVANMCNENLFTLEYLAQLSRNQHNDDAEQMSKQEAAEDEDEDENEDGDEDVEMKDEEEEEDESEEDEDEGEEAEPVRQVVQVKKEKHAPLGKQSGHKQQQQPSRGKQRKVAQ